MCRKPDTHRFQFRPAISVDKPLVHRWLKQDYIREWIHGAGLESTLTGLDIFDEFVAPWHPVPHWLMRLNMGALG